MVTEDVEPITDQLWKINAMHTFGEIYLQLREHSVDLSVKPDCDHLTLGGVLSAGGFGYDSIKKGSLMDNIQSFELLLPTGEQITCTNDHELFYLALSGFGRFGIITSCTMYVTKNIYRSARRLIFGDDHEAFFTALKQLAFNDQVDFLYCHNDLHKKKENMYCLTYGRNFSLSSEAIPLTEQDYGQTTSSHIPWTYKTEFSPKKVDGVGVATEFIFPDIHAIVELDDYVRHNYPYDKCPLYIFPIKNLTTKYPLHTLSPSYFPPHIPLLWGYGIYHYDFDEQFYKELLHICIRSGGRPYLWGHHKITQQERETIYTKTTLDYISQKKREIDPYNILNPVDFPSLD